MPFQQDTFMGSDGETLITYFKMIPETKVRGVIQIVHGMREYMERYTDLAEYLCDKGYVICGEDHMGHGRSVGEGGIYGYFGREDGWEHLIEDVEKLHRIMKETYKDTPYIVLGHSMGSFIARNWYARYGNDCAGLILSGTAKSNKLLRPLTLLAKIQRLFLGDKRPAHMLDRTINKQYLKRISKPKTPADWISYDEAAVKKYMADPLCIFTFTHSGYIDLFRLLRECNADSWYESIPKDKPILIISGDEDPVGDYGEGPQKIYDKLIESGQVKVTIDIRHGMRHEPHNEIGREAVFSRYASYLYDNFSKDDAEEKEE